MKIYWNGTSKNIIGSNLKKLRKKAGMTQKTLAEKLQLDRRAGFYRLNYFEDRAGEKIRSRL